MNTKLSLSNKPLVIAISFVVFLVTLVVLHYANNLALHIAIHSSLKQLLPSALNDALVNSYDVEPLLKHSESLIKSWLESAKVMSLFDISTINSLEVLEISLTSMSSTDHADLTFQLGDQHYGVSWRVAAERSALLLLFIVSSSALIGFAAYCLLQHKTKTYPSPVNHEIYDTEPEALTRPQNSTLPAIEATNKPRGPVEPNSTIDHRLTIHLLDRTITIGQHKLTMSKTPFFYYYWYIKRSIDNLPPYINPPSTKPDIDNGRELAQMMRCFGGHARAINELEQHGLKAKTLDQNRNKIKDEMLAHFGERAEPYLFLKSRDPKTGRYQHQLAKNIFTIKTKG
ncbi:hypothetical protein [Vibrio maritimus]|uniref:hypothetical protein n=1 Tax=Vibrio maritimus TaxID=990268 RepID=UPI001F2AA0C9|nr:hypothetical protein [Vibrio maritimus]